MVQTDCNFCGQEALLQQQVPVFLRMCMCNGVYMEFFKKGRPGPLGTAPATTALLKICLAIV